MNKNMIKKIVFAFAIMLSGMTYGQSIITGGGDTIATISASGIIIDLMSQPVGEITSNGEVKNAAGQLLGNIVGDFFNNTSGLLLGEKKIVGGITQLVLPGDVVIATIDSGNKLVDNNGGGILMQSSGTISETQLIAYFLYF